VPKRLPMRLAFLRPGRRCNRSACRASIGHRIPANEIHEYVDRPTRTAQICRVNLIQPSHFRFGRAQFFHYIRQAMRPISAFRIASRVAIFYAKMGGTRFLQRLDGGLKPLDLPADFLLLRYPEVHSVQIERHKFLAALDQRLRQELQQCEALLEQIQINFNVLAHGVTPFRRACVCLPLPACRSVEHSAVERFWRD